MTTLSPAAQAIKDAALSTMYVDCNVRSLVWPLDMPVVAAAIRALVEHVHYDEHLDTHEDYEAKLLTIAAELEAQP